MPHSPSLLRDTPNSPHFCRSARTPTSVGGLGIALAKCDYEQQTLSLHCAPANALIFHNGDLDRRASQHCTATALASASYESTAVALPVLRTKPITARCECEAAHRSIDCSSRRKGMSKMARYFRTLQSAPKQGRSVQLLHPPSGVCILTTIWKLWIAGRS